MVYILFSDPSLTVPFASYLSILCTLVLVMSVVTIFVEAGVILDIALVCLFVVFCSRMAFLESINRSRNVHYLSTTIYNLFSKETGLGQLFSLDSLISMILALLSLLYFKYSYFFEGDELDGLSSGSSMSNDNNEGLAKSFLNSFSGTLIVLLYTNVILSLYGNVLPDGVAPRIFQAVLALGYYGYRLYQSGEEVPFHLKQY